MPSIIRPPSPTRASSSVQNSDLRPLWWLMYCAVPVDILEDRERPPLLAQWRTMLRSRQRTVPFLGLVRNRSKHGRPEQ